MHINRKLGEQVDVGWAGNPAFITNPDTCEIIKTYIFVGVMTYSLYAYAEACVDVKQKSWGNAHIHRYEKLGGSASPLADAIIEQIAHDSYVIGIRSIDDEDDISMLAVYGLVKTLCE